MSSNSQDLESENGSTDPSSAFYPSADSINDGRTVDIPIELDGTAKTFKVNIDGQNFPIEAKDATEYDSWIEALRWAEQVGEPSSIEARTKAKVVVRAEKRHRESQWFYDLPPGAQAALVVGPALTLVVVGVMYLYWPRLTAPPRRRRPLAGSTRMHRPPPRDPTPNGAHSWSDMAPGSVQTADPSQTFVPTHDPSSHTRDVELGSLIFSRSTTLAETSHP